MTLSFLRNREEVPQKNRDLFFSHEMGLIVPQSKRHKVIPHNSKSQNHNNPMLQTLQSYHLYLRYLGDVMYMLHLHYYYFLHIPWSFRLSHALTILQLTFIFTVQKFYSMSVSPLGSEVGQVFFIIFEIKHVMVKQKEKPTTKREDY